MNSNSRSGCARGRALVLALASVVLAAPQVPAHARPVKPRVYFTQDQWLTWPASCYGPTSQVTNHYDDVHSAWSVMKANWDLQNSKFLTYGCVSTNYNIPITIQESVVPATASPMYLNGQLLSWDTWYHNETYDYRTGARNGVSPSQLTGYAGGRYECPLGRGWLELPGSTAQKMLAQCVKADDVKTRECPSCNAVYPSKGVNVQEETDYRGVGDFPLEYQRNYSSAANGWRGGHEGYVVDGAVGAGKLTSAAQGCHQGVGHDTHEPDCYEYVVGPQEVLLVRGTDEPIGFDSQSNFSPPGNVNLRIAKMLDGAGQPAGWLVRDPDQLTFETLDTAGRVIVRTHISGKRHTFAYNTGPGSLASITDTFGRQLQFTPDAQGRVQAMRDPAQSTYQYLYSPTSRVIYGTAGNLVGVIYPDTSQKGYVYNEQSLTNHLDMPNMLTGITDELNKRFATFAYDDRGAGPIAVSAEHAGGVEKYTFTQTTPLQNRRTVVTDAMGAAQTITYQQIGDELLPISRSQPAGSGCAASTSAAAYDANGNRTSADDFNGNRVCYVNDLSRNLETARVEGLSNTAVCSGVTPAGVVLPAGSRKLSSQWHPDWRLKTKQAEPGKLTTWVYNGQPDPFNGGAVASCAPSTAVLPDGKPIAVLCKQVEQATSDADGHLGFSAPTQNTVPSRVASYTYNAYGQVLTAKGPRTDVNDTTTYAYYSDTSFTGTDPNASGHTIGDLQSMTNALNKVTQYPVYDKHGHVLRVVDANNVATDYTYDLRQHLTSVSVAGQTTAYAYWPTGLLKRVTQADASTLDYSYDDAHRLVSTVDNLGNHLDYTLDNAGNRITEKVVDPSGVLSRQLGHMFDPLNRLEQTTAGQSGVGQPADPFFSNVGLLLHMDGANGTSVFPDASARTKTPTNIVLPVAIDTANPKFGSASANFTGGYLWYAPSPDFDMGAGDFTVEMWAKFNDASLYSRAFLFYQADVNGLKGTFGVSKTTSDLLSMSLHSDAGTFVFTGTVPVSRNVWYHLAMVRSGNTLTLYKNGAVELSGPISGTVPVVTSQFGVGIVGEYIYGYGGYYGTQMMGWLDDFRITKGVARYTGPFTPPAAALADH